MMTVALLMVFSYVGYNAFYFVSRSGNDVTLKAIVRYYTCITHDNVAPVQFSTFL